jgi:hypothetical protein
MGDEILRRIFAFNGDADGLCALQQLVLAQGTPPSTLITGPKRRTRLLDEVSAGPGDEVTALDISFHANREGVQRLLAAGARVRYFDHHHAGDVPVHERLEAHIDLSSGICTSAIVDRHLGGACVAWAAVGAFGDNLADTALDLAARAGLSVQDTALIERLGMLLNYNSYGESEADLHFAPAELHRRLVAHRDPRAFMREDAAFARLAAGHDEDMAQVAGLAPAAAQAGAALYVLPDASWARRVSGVLANELARGAPSRAHALLSPNSAGGMQVSVRAPLERPTGAAALCLGYATGGGREGAAGINHLPLEEVSRFTARFLSHFA